MLVLLVSGNTLAQHPASFSVNDLNGENGFTMQGLNETDWLSYAISTAGDVNHDGVNDLLLGAHMTDNPGANAGSAYVIYGNDVIFSDAFESSQ